MLEEIDRVTWMEHWERIRPVVGGMLSLHSNGSKIQISMQDMKGIECRAGARPLVCCSNHVR